MSEPQALPPAPAAAPNGNATGTLSITTEPSPLAVTVYDHRINTLATVVSPAQVKLPPGLYLVRAARAGYPDLTEMAWVLANSDRAVRLSAGTPSLWQGTTQGLSSLLDRYVRNVPQFEVATPSSAGTALPRKQEPYWLRFLRLRDWDNAEPVDAPSFKAVAEGSKDILHISNPPGLVFAQVARKDQRTVNVALPPAGALWRARCSLVVASHEDTLEAHVRLGTDWANSALQYMAQGLFDEAERLVKSAAEREPSWLASAGAKLAELINPAKESRIGGVIQHVVNRFEDPAAALVPRYLSLRTQRRPVLPPSSDFFFDTIERFADGIVISAEIAARKGDYKKAAERLLTISDGALPLFSEGFSILTHLTKQLCELGPDDVHDATELPSEGDRKKLKGLLRHLFKWAPFVDVSSPTLTFRGNNLAKPKYDEAPQDPTVKDGWLPAPEL